MTMRHHPIRTASLATLSALLLASAAQAQVYRVVGPDGRVSYSDKPPAAAATSSGNVSARGAAPANNLPYALAQTAQRYPVTLYSGQGCAPCDSGRALLTSRGIPFTEKTVNTNEDAAALQKLAGSPDLPLLSIGAQRISGFSDRDWHQYLDAAGYPKTSQLPGAYRNPAPTALAPAAPAPSAPPAPAPAPETASTPAPAGPSIAPERTSTNPAGIRF